jgi:hypothetical protein
MNSAGAFEAKAKKELRKSGGLPRGTVLYIEDDGTFKTFALRIFLANLLIKRTDVSFAESEKNAVRICGDTLEDVAGSLLENVFSGTVTEHIGEAKNHISPFAAIPEEEVLAYAQYFGWSGTPEETKPGA